MANALSIYLLPGVVCVILIAGMLRRGPILQWFAEGAAEGFRSLFSIAPFLLGMFVAVGLFRASGAMDALSGLLAPVLRFFSVPKELASFAVVRPISGSGALALLSDIYKNYGADSAIGRMASLMMGSTETIFYTLCVYMGAAGMKKAGFALPAALVAALTGVIAAVWAVNLGL